MDEYDKELERQCSADRAALDIAVCVIGACLIALLVAMVVFRGDALKDERRAHVETKELLRVAEADAKDAALRLNEALATIAALRGTTE